MTQVHLGLSGSDLEAELIPREGGVLTSLKKSGFEFLSKTPWAENVGSWETPAEDEQTWVSRWRGGWQLCAPSTGEADPNASTPAFHGAASQAIWKLISSDSLSATLEWRDPEDSFAITRRWTLNPPNQIRVETTMKNLSLESRRFGIAEHLILGSDFLRPCEKGSSAKLQFSEAAKVVELDYFGFPTGQVLENASAEELWTTCKTNQPARVFALTDLENKKITVTVANRSVEIGWDGLSHALIWQEFGTSVESPWNSKVFALGIEPTSTAHGAGLQAGDSPLIGPNQEINWVTSLTFQD